jgi:hypothetical protein
MSSSLNLGLQNITTFSGNPLNMKTLWFTVYNTSTAEATLSKLASPHGRPISCKHIGRPCLSWPTWEQKNQDINELLSYQWTTSVLFFLKQHRGSLSATMPRTFIIWKMLQVLSYDTTYRHSYCWKTKKVPGYDESHQVSCRKRWYQERCTWDLIINKQAYWNHVL